MQTRSQIAVLLLSNLLLAVVLVDRSVVMARETGHVVTFVIIGVGVGLVQVGLMVACLARSLSVITAVVSSVGYLAAYVAFGVERSGGDGLWVFAFVFALVVVSIVTFVVGLMSVVGRSDRLAD